MFKILNTFARPIMNSWHLDNRSIRIAILILMCFLSNPVNSDVTGEIISAVALDYDRNANQTNQSTSLVGKTFTLGGFGIVADKKMKSGWVNINTKASYIIAQSKGDDEIHTLKLRGVSFWVNDNGNNWFDFEIKNIIDTNTGKQLHFTTRTEKICSLCSVLVIELEDGTTLHAKMNNSLHDLHFWGSKTDAPREAKTREFILGVQKFLKEKKFYKGSLDGLMGPNTKFALFRAQLNWGMPMSGEIDLYTFRDEDFQRSYESIKGSR